MTHQLIFSAPISVFIVFQYLSMLSYKLILCECVCRVPLGALRHGTQSAVCIAGKSKVQVMPGLIQINGWAGSPHSRF